MDYFHRKCEARALYEYGKSATEATVAARFGTPFDKNDIPHCIAYTRSLEALPSDDERLKIHGWTPEQSISFAYR